MARSAQARSRRRRWRRIARGRVASGFLGALIALFVQWFAGPHGLRSLLPRPHVLSPAALHVAMAVAEQTVTPAAAHGTSSVTVDPGALTPVALQVVVRNVSARDGEIPQDLLLDVSSPLTNGFSNLFPVLPFAELAQGSLTNPVAGPDASASASIEPSPARAMVIAGNAGWGFQRSQGPGWGPVGHVPINIRPPTDAQHYVVRLHDLAPRLAAHAALRISFSTWVLGDEHGPDVGVDALARPDGAVQWVDGPVETRPGGVVDMLFYVDNAGAKALRQMLVRLCLPPTLHVITGSGRQAISGETTARPVLDLTRGINFTAFDPDQLGYFVQRVRVDADAPAGATLDPRWALSADDAGKGEDDMPLRVAGPQAAGGVPRGGRSHC